jgi:FKBP-type peptidyl-prolyl cis-trans isomerase FklB
MPMFATRTTVLTVILSTAVVAPLLASGTNELNDETSRVSYAIGMMYGEGWKAHGITGLNYDLLLKGLKDAEGGGTPLMTEQEIRSTLQQYQQELAKKAEQKREDLAANNLKIGDAFLAKNKEKRGVVTMPDGLQYKVITTGSGASPAESDTVTVSYDGTLIDGTSFDKSDKATFRLSGIIPGWREALTHMKVGSEWQLFVPPNLAYGTYGRPPRIEPNSLLIFKLHLLSIEHPKPITSDIIKVPSAEEMKKGAKVQIIKPEDVQKMQQESPSAK